MWVTESFFTENEQFPHTLTRTSVTHKEFPTPSYSPSLSSKLGLSPHSWQPIGSGSRTGRDEEILREESEMRLPLIEELRKCRNTRETLCESWRRTSSSRRRLGPGSCWRAGASGWDSWSVEWRWQNSGMEQHRYWIGFMTSARESMKRTKIWK